MPSSLLIDQFVGNCAQPLRYAEAERLRSLEVNDKLEIGWLLNRQVRRLSALKYPIDINGSTPGRVVQARSIGHQAANLRKLSEIGDRRRPAIQSKLGNPRGISGHQRCWQYDERLGPYFGDQRERTVEIFAPACLHQTNRHTRGPSCFLRFPQ